MAGAKKIQAPQVVDGKSFVTLLKGGKMNPNRPLLFHTPNVWGEGNGNNSLYSPSTAMAPGGLEADLLAPHPEVRTLQHQGRHQRGAQPGGTASGPRESHGKNHDRPAQGPQGPDAHLQERQPRRSPGRLPRAVAGPGGGQAVKASPPLPGKAALFPFLLRKQGVWCGFPVFIPFSILFTIS